MDVRNRNRLVKAVIAAALTPATMANAQAWTSLPSSSPDSQIAGAVWADQTRIVARCDAGQLTAFISKAETTPGAVAYVLTQRRPDDPRGAWWRLSEDGNSVVARQPIAFVRDLRQGGIFDIVVKSRDLPDWETTVTLPTEAGALETVMSSCGVTPAPPETDSRRPLSWLTPPRPSSSDYPGGALNEGTSGVASISCHVSREGVPQDCIVLDEAPLGAGFGYSAARIVARGRLSVDERAFEENQRPIFNTTVPFRMERKEVPSLPFISRVQTETEGMFPEQEPK